jgi:hypothetical protein
LPISDDSYISAITPLVFIISLITMSLIIIIQIKKNLKGTKINKKKSTIYLLYYILIVFYIIYNSFLTGLPIILLIPYIFTIIFSGFFSYWYSKRNLVFWQDKIESNIQVKGGLLIYLLYVSALIIRIAISFILIGFQEINFTPTGNIVLISHPIIHTNSNFRTISLIITDILVMLGTGMLFGRYIRIMQYIRYRNNSSSRIV